MRILMVFRSLKDIKATIPERLFVRDTRRGLMYLSRDLILAATAWNFATWIDPYFKASTTKTLLTPVGAQIGRWFAWAV
jgi:hypothetical protein